MGLNVPGDFTRGKKKVSTCPEAWTRGKERMKDLDFPGDVARWKAKVKLSTSPAISPAGR